MNETRQAVSNVAAVFAAAFPYLGESAFAERATGCQLMIAGPPSPVWDAVRSEFAEFFTRQNATAAAAVSTTTGFPAGTLPIPANVAVSCEGVGLGTDRFSVRAERVGSTGVKAEIGDFSSPPRPRAQRPRVVAVQFQGSAVLARDISDAFARLADAFSSAFKDSFPPCSDGHRASPAAILQATATECQLWLADPAVDVDATLALLAQLFAKQLPPLTVTKAALPAHGLGEVDGPNIVALQCFGSQRGGMAQEAAT